jgi:hypothetical protein
MALEVLASGTFEMSVSAACATVAVKLPINAAAAAVVAALVVVDSCLMLASPVYSQLLEPVAPAQFERTIIDCTTA